MPAEKSPTRGSNSASLLEKRNSPHPSRDFLHYKAPSKSDHPDRSRYMRYVGESFYQDYTGGNRGDVGTGVKTKGWSVQHDTNVYLGNALCNLAHDPAAPPVVDKKDLLRNISRSYSRSILRSRSASGTREKIWSTNILEDAKKPPSRPRSQSAKHLGKQESTHEVRSDVKRFLDSRTVEERSEIYRYLQSKERESKGRREKGQPESEDKSSSKSPRKLSGKSEDRKSKGEEKKDGQSEEKDSPRNLKAKKSQKYKHQRARQAQSATGTLFSVAAARQPAHFAIFPDWPSEKDPPKKQ